METARHCQDCPIIRVSPYMVLIDNPDVFDSCER